MLVEAYVIHLMETGSLGRRTMTAWLSRGSELTIEGYDRTVAVKVRGGVPVA